MKTGVMYRLDLRREAPESNARIATDVDDDRLGWDGPATFLRWKYDRTFEIVPETSKAI